MGNILKTNQFVEYYGKLVSVESLPKMSSKTVICVCDICGEEVSKMLKHYYIAIEKHKGVYICKKCFNHNKEIVENRMRTTKNTCIEKYGVDNPLKDSSIKSKIKQTLMDKYGVEYSGKIEQAKEKKKLTCLERYGVEYPVVLCDNKNCHSKESREKAMNTMRKRYGGVGFEIEKNRIKAKEALASSGNVKTSS